MCSCIAVSSRQQQCSCHLYNESGVAVARTNRLNQSISSPHPSGAVSPELTVPRKNQTILAGVEWMAGARPRVGLLTRLLEPPESRKPCIWRASQPKARALILGAVAVGCQLCLRPVRSHPLARERLFELFLLIVFNAAPLFLSLSLSPSRVAVVLKLSSSYYSSNSLPARLYCFFYTYKHQLTRPLPLPLPPSPSPAVPLYRRLNLGPQLALRSSEPFPAASSKNLVWLHFCLAV
jgi:hypothetical protein